MRPWWQYFAFYLKSSTRLANVAVPQKTLRVEGSFAQRNTIVQYPDMPSRENPFAYRNNLLIRGSLIGYLTLVERVDPCPKRCGHLQLLRDRLTVDRPTVDRPTVDSSQIGHLPEPDELLALRICSLSRKGVWLYDSASVAAITPHFEDLSDVRVSDLRTVKP
jgi:hypothetical protein